MQTLKNYYELTKPRLLYGNLVTTVAGFVFGSRGIESTNFTSLALSTLAIAFIMASGCVINNLIDRDIDKIMERTKTRASAQGKIKTEVAVVFAALLLANGLGILFALSMNIAACTVFVGFLAYAGIYSLYAKRHSNYGTFIGAVAGATPPLAGYAAASGHIDMSGLAVFAMMILWQMPHAWAIALYRKSDYAKAEIPVLPVTDPGSVKSNTLNMIIMFGLTSLLPYAFDRAGVYYAIIALLLSIKWWLVTSESLPTKDGESETEAGRKLFRFSLLVIMGTFITLALDAK